MPRAAKRYPPCSDAELERCAASSQLSEEVHRWLDDLGLTPATELFVVARGDGLTEVVLRHEAALLSEPAGIRNETAPSL